MTLTGGGCVVEFTLETDNVTGDLPFQCGSTRLNHAQHCTRLSVMPFADGEAAVSDALTKAGAPRLSAIGHYDVKQAIRVIWAGHRHWFVEGTTTEVLGAVPAAIVDQSDGWIAFDLLGADACDVLARLCPLDLSPDTFAVGQVARSEVAHVMGCILAVDDGFQVMVMRSVALDVIKHVKQAMRSISAQAVLTS